MSKKVGASGHISLGKEHAGQQFDVIAHPDGRFELIPVQGVASATPHLSQVVVAPDGWVPPGYDQCTQWALDNRVAIEQYAQRIDEEGTAAEQLYKYLADHPELLHGSDG